MGARLADDPRFNTPEMRWGKSQALNADHIEEWTGQRSKHEVMRVLGKPGCRGRPARTPAKY